MEREAGVGSEEHISLAELQRGERIQQEGRPYWPALQTPHSPGSARVSIWSMPKRHWLGQLGHLERAHKTASSLEVVASVDLERLLQNAEASLQT